MMNNCCSNHDHEPKKVVTPSCCAPDHDDPHAGHKHAKWDWMMLTCAPLIIIGYLLHLTTPAFLNNYDWLETFSHGVHQFVNASWWGVVIGILFLSLMSKIPREFVMSILGNKKGAGSIGRAMFGGVLLDLCSHGILMIATKLYQRGASVGQVIAFLISSPWNSLSLTLILIALIGLKLTLLFLVLSCVVAFITGMIFDALVDRKILPANPNAFDMPDDFKFMPEAKRQLLQVQWSPSFFVSMISGGIKDAGIVIRWLLFGIVIASALRVFMDPETFTQYFGPTMIGLAATVFFATILEVCSEGSSPIAADFVTRAGAPGNAFAFLMAGAATDYTEIMIMKDTTKSWKLALFIPLISLPQVIILAILINIGMA
jgi:uncharacterized membrane protein YraQ (UPF0718 family)